MEMARDGNGIPDSHEDRIQRLESGYQQVSTQLAETTVKLDYIAESIEDKSHNISDKIDICNNNINKLCEKVSTNHERIEDLEESEKRRLEKRKFWKKISVALIVASVGAVGSMLVEYFTKFLHHSH